MIMASFIFPNQSSLNNIPIGLVVGDQSSISQQVISFINKANQQENYFKIDNIDSKEEAILNIIRTREQSKLKVLFYKDRPLSSTGIYHS